MHNASAPDRSEGDVRRPGLPGRAGIALAQVRRRCLRSPPAPVAPAGGLVFDGSNPRSGKEEERKTSLVWYPHNAVHFALIRTFCLVIDRPSTCRWSRHPARTASHGAGAIAQGPRVPSDSLRVESQASAHPLPLPYFFTPHLINRIRLAAGNSTSSQHFCEGGDSARTLST